MPPHHYNRPPRSLDTPHDPPECESGRELIRALGGNLHVSPPVPNDPNRELTVAEMRQNRDALDTVLGDLIERKILLEKRIAKVKILMRKLRMDIEAKGETL